MTEHKALLVLNGGLGNGLVVYPILKAVHPGTLTYYATHNDWLEKNAAQLPGLQGFVPNIWRRFQNGAEMLQFMHEHQIDTVLNGRKEDPRYDAVYFTFRKELLARQFRVFDLYEELIPLDAPIGHQIAAMFRQAIPDLPEIDWRPLRHAIGHMITFYVGSSMPKKLPTMEYMTRAIEHTIKSFPGIEVCIAAGKLPFEHSILPVYAEQFAPKANVVQVESLDDALNLIHKTKVLITPDTSISHLAGMTSCKVITIFTCTDARVWRNSTQDLSEVVQSQLPVHCQYMKNDGNCSKFYTDCTECQGQDLDPLELCQRIAQAVEVS